MKSGDNGEEDPPVPIPNTEVKLFSAEDTWRETAWENRSLPVLREKQFTKVDCYFREREVRASKTGQRGEILNLLHCRKNIKKKKKENRPEEERKSSSWKQIEIEGCFFLSVAWGNRTLRLLKEKQFMLVKHPIYYITFHDV